MEKNIAAQRLHEEGLQSALRNEFGRAHSAFAFALDALHDEPESVASAAQAADIARDQGFTIVREAIGAESPMDATRHLGVAWVHLSNVAARVSNVLAQNIVGTYEQESLLANRGATRMLLGRTATVAAVLERPIITPDDEHIGPIEAGRTFYQLAYLDLLHGNNGYYRVSNAMTAARHERLFGSGRSVIRWLGRGAVGLAWTDSYDLVNAASAWSTFRDRMPHLRSRGIAADSVLTKP